MWMLVALWVLLWLFLVYRARRGRILHFYQRGNYHLFFHGWALVWECKLEPSYSSIPSSFPSYDTSSSTATPPPMTMVMRSNASSHTDGLTPPARRMSRRRSILQPLEGEQADYDEEAGGGGAGDLNENNGMRMYDSPIRHVEWTCPPSFYRGLESCLRSYHRITATRGAAATTAAPTTAPSSSCHFFKWCYNTGIILFVVGQCLILLFMIWNVVITLLESDWFSPTSPISPLLHHHTPSAFTSSSSSSISLSSFKSLGLLATTFWLRAMSSSGTSSSSTSSSEGGSSPSTPASSSTFHLATRMRPMLPGSTSEGGTGVDPRYLWFAALLALIYHELGHFSAARKEGLPIRQIGLYLAIILPGAYVIIDDRIHHLSPTSQLRVMCAGVWHNFLLCLLTVFILQMGVVGRLFTTTAAGKPVTTITSAGGGKGIGGAVIEVSPPPTSSFHNVFRPGRIITALQDQPTLCSLSFLEALQQQAQQANKRALALHSCLIKEKEGNEEEGKRAKEEKVILEHMLKRFFTSNAQLTAEEVDTLAAIGLLQWEAMCTDMDLGLKEMMLRDGGQGEPPLLRDGGQGEPPPSCCRPSALLGEERGGVEEEGDGGTSCFLYQRHRHDDVGGGEEDAAGEKGILTCFPARDLALRSMMLDRRRNSSSEHQQQQQQLPPHCFTPVMIPPNTLLKLSFSRSGGHLLLFEGMVDEVFLSLEGSLSDDYPRPWLRSLLPITWAMALPNVITSFLATLLDVSFSIGVLNLIPSGPLDGTHASLQLLLLLSTATSNFLPPFHARTVHHYVTQLATILLTIHLVFGLISLLE